MRVITFLLLTLVIVSMVGTVKAGAIVEDADYVKEIEVPGVPTELKSATIAPRTTVEYAQVILKSPLRISNELLNRTSDTFPRTTVEYAQVILKNTLGISEELLDTTRSVAPRVIAEYTSKIVKMPLVFPKELINDPTPPIITNITVANITGNSATTKWDTDEFANSIVNYGTSSSVYTKQESDELFVKNHTVSLRNLSPGTKYYFVVESTDLSEKSVESREYRFTTTGVPGKPKISISTDKYEYTTGETMNINITLANPAEEWKHVYFAWRLDLPDHELQYWVMINELYLPPDYEQTFTIPFTVGDYGIPFNASWYVALYNTTTLEVLSEDTADWRYESAKMVEGETIPEEIAEAVETKIEKALMEHFLLEKEPALRKILPLINETFAIGKHNK